MTDRPGNPGAPGSGVATGTVQVWDQLVRVSCWTRVAGIAIAWLTAEELDTTKELDEVHEIAGYVVAGLIAFRLVWGLIGSRYARFAQFVKRPAATLGCIRDMIRRRERRYLGRNPAGQR